MSTNTQRPEAIHTATQTVTTNQDNSGIQAADHQPTPKSLSQSYASEDTSPVRETPQFIVFVIDSTLANY